MLRALATVYRPVGAVLLCVCSCTCVGFSFWSRAMREMKRPREKGLGPLLTLAEGHAALEHGKGAVWEARSR